jgi:hypothetical protein
VVQNRASKSEQKKSPITLTTLVALWLMEQSFCVVLMRMKGSVRFALNQSLLQD